MDAEAPRPRILIVDDHADNVEVLRARLEASGYATESAADGEEALARVAAHPPDLILLDVMMPRLNGLEVARRIKGDRSLPFIPIIMQTALDTVEHKVRGLAAGADDYVTKPVNMAELEARMRSMLRIKALQETVQRHERDLEAANAELQRLAILDGLTGLYNRRHLDERLREMFEHALRFDEPLAAVMFDLDRFKRVNDRYGHDAGDEVLRTVARRLRETAREVDRVGRYGGEEFLALLPGTTADAAVTFAERARHTVAAHRFSFGGELLRQTISCGVAAWPHPEIRTRETLVRAADAALYAAKVAGRDRVVRFAAFSFAADHGALDDQHGSAAPGGAHRVRRRA